MMFNIVVNCDTTKLFTSGWSLRRAFKAFTRASNYNSRNQQVHVLSWFRHVVFIMCMMYEKAAANGLKQEIFDLENVHNYSISM